MIGGFHQHLERDARGRRSIRRRAFHDESRRVARWHELGKVIGSCEDLAAALEPVLGRHTHQRRHHRPLNASHRVAPGLVPAQALERGIQPPVGDPRATDERRCAVDDEQLAVRTIVQPRQRIPPHPLIRLDPASRLTEPAYRAAPQAQAADRVHDDGNGNPLTGLGGQLRHELIGDFPGLEDVELHVDRAGRPADGLQHRGIERDTVGEDRDAVPVMQRRLTCRLERVHEVRRMDRCAVGEMIGDARREEKNEHDPGEEDAAGNRQPEHQYADVRREVAIGVIRRSIARVARASRRSMTPAPLN